MSLEQAGSLFEAGDLSGAVAAATAAVKASPAAAPPRLLLAELLLFSNELERADKLLAALDTMAPDMGIVVAEFRQLLRAATTRQRVAFKGGVPSFLDGPTTAQQAALRGAVALRAGDTQAAAAAAAELETLRPRVAGSWQTAGASGMFDDFRDADDLLAGSFELLTTTGAYYWIPSERLATLDFHPPKRPRDLIWRRCTAAVQGGPDGDVYVPAIYPTMLSLPDPLRLGRQTDWTAVPPVRGSGQRLFLAGDEGLPILDIVHMEFAVAEAGAVEDA